MTAPSNRPQPLRIQLPVSGGGRALALPDRARDQLLVAFEDGVMALNELRRVATPHLRLLH